MEVTFDFWTNLCGCGGGHAGGTCTMEMSEEEFDDLSMEELIDRCMEDNCDGVLDFYVVEISFD